MIIAGNARLGKEPKMSFTPKGVAQTYALLAVDCGFGDRKETVWLGLWAYGQQAEFLNKYFGKGAGLEFSAEVTGLYTYAKDDGETGGNVNGRFLTIGFNGNSKKKAGNNTPFDEEIVEIAEPEDF